MQKRLRPAAAAEGMDGPRPKCDAQCSRVRADCHARGPAVSHRGRRRAERENLPPGSRSLDAARGTANQRCPDDAYRSAPAATVYADRTYGYSGTPCHPRLEQGGDRPAFLRLRRNDCRLASTGRRRFAASNKHAGESFSGCRSLRRAADQAVLPRTGQSEDRRYVGQGRHPYCQDDGRAYSQGKAGSRSGTFAGRHRQTKTDRGQVPQPYLARRFDCRADFGRILDQLDSQRHLAALARLLVAVERSGPLFETIGRFRGLQEKSDLRGSDGGAVPDHVPAARATETHDRRPRSSVQVRAF